MTAELAEQMTVVLHRQSGRQIGSSSNCNSRSSKFRSAELGGVDWIRGRSGPGVRPTRGQHGKRMDNSFLRCFLASDPGRGLTAPSNFLGS